MSTVTTPKPTFDHSHEFEALFRDHYLLVYRTACVITGSREDAEDVLQTIFLRLMRRAAPPDVAQKPKGILLQGCGSPFVGYDSLTATGSIDVRLRTN